MLKRFISSSLLMAVIGSGVAITVPQAVLAQASQKEGAVTTVIAQNDEKSETVALMTRQQQRTAMLERDLRDLRGLVETDLRQLKLQIEQMANSSSDDGSRMSSDIRALSNQLEQLSDSIAMTNRRMERTLEITSDVEFRLLRLEKRMQTIMRMGGNDVANAMIQQDTIAMGESEEVQMSRDSNDGSVTWSMDKESLEAHMDGDNGTGEAASVAAVDDGAGTEIVAAADQVQASLRDGTTDSDASVGGAAQDNDTAIAVASVEQPSEAPAAPPTPEVLPDVSPEDQYMFAMNSAMQNDLETAERAFSEFRTFNPDHAREVDAAYWLGRVQFMRQKYEEAAMTFTQFNTDYPQDDRLTDTTLYIAESVSHFAPAEQACDIYASLPTLFEAPSELFLKNLNKLSKAANCAAE